VFLTEKAAIELNPDEFGTLFRPANGRTHFTEITAQELPDTDSNCPGILAHGARTALKGELIGRIMKH
jgi:hypothetical protein